MRPNCTIAELDKLDALWRAACDECTATGETQIILGSEGPAVSAYVMALQRHGARLLRAARKCAEIIEPLERLRASEGASVTILCPNPDLGLAAQAIEVIDDWTDWQEKRFVGATLEECLRKAEEARLLKAGS